MSTETTALPSSPPRIALSRRACRRIAAFLGTLLAVWLGFVAFAQVAVSRDGGKIHTAAAQVPERPVAIVFGAKVYPGGGLSPVLDRRVRAGVELYRRGKVRKLLMSGDNGRQEYDEVSAMKRRAVELGVPARDVVRDYAGFRTYDTCIRARQIFGVESAVLVTQAFHLPRALYLARHLGIDAVGFQADPGMPVEMVQGLELREVAARAAAVSDCLFHRRPRFLGPREPLFEDERDDR